MDGIECGPPQLPSSGLKMEKIVNARRGDNGLTIRLSWDTSIYDHPQSEQLKLPFRTAANILVNLISSHVVHNVVCYHKVDLPPGQGESTTTLFTFPSYQYFRNAYKTSTSNSSIRKEFLQCNLPEQSQLISVDNGIVFFLSATQQTLFDISSPQLEHATFSNQCFVNLLDPNCDLIGICLHELTETLGRLTGFTDPSNGKKYRSLLECSSFTKEGERSFEHFTPNSYFSINNGQSSLAYFNTNNKGDAMDWDNSRHKEDCFKANLSTTTDSNDNISLTLVDLTVLQVLGYNLAPIEYPFDTLKIPTGIIFKTSLRSNYSFIKGIKEFKMEPNLPEGLIFSPVSGEISGQTKKACELKTYKVSFDNTIGQFDLTVMERSGSSLAPVNNPQEQSDKVKNDANSGLSTAAIVSIALLSILLLVLIIGISILLTRKS
jgi:hypothetical protein